MWFVLWQALLAGGSLAVLLPLLQGRLLLLLLLCALFAVLCCVTRGSAELRRIPGGRGLPVLGNVLDLPRSLEDLVPWIAEWCQLYPGLSRGHLLHLQYVVISSAEAAEPILSSRRLLDKGRDYQSIRPWFGDGLLTSTGALWHRHRKLITPAFHFSILDQFLVVMNEQAGELVRRLHSQVPDEAQVAQLNIWPYISDAALDIICQAAMGVRIQAQSGGECEYRAAVKTMGDIVFVKTIRPWLRSEPLFWLSGLRRRQDQALQVLQRFCVQVIERRRAQLRDQAAKTSGSGNPRRRLAFLDLLLQNTEEGDECLTDEEVRDEVNTFIFEGHDTTSAGISWALYNVGRFPDIQRRLSEELDGIFADSDRAPSREDLNRMKYLECVIRESLRLYPPVPLFSRTLRQSASVDGYTIPAGTEAVFFPFMIHRDKHHWPEPEVFRPERFEGASDRHPFSYLPFSAGPRNCIGQRFALLEEKAVISAVLRNFWLESCCEPHEQLQFWPSLTLQKHGPLTMRLTPK